MDDWLEDSNTVKDNSKKPELLNNNLDINTAFDIISCMHEDKPKKENVDTKSEDKKSEVAINIEIKKNPETKKPNKKVNKKQQLKQVRNNDYDDDDDYEQYYEEYDEYEKYEN